MSYPQNKGNANDSEDEEPITHERGNMLVR